MTERELTTGRAADIAHDCADQARTAVASPGPADQRCQAAARGTYLALEAAWTAGCTYACERYEAGDDRAHELFLAIDSAFLAAEATMKAAGMIDGPTRAVERAHARAVEHDERGTAGEMSDADARTLASWAADAGEELGLGAPSLRIFGRGGEWMSSGFGEARSIMRACRADGRAEDAQALRALADRISEACYGRGSATVNA